MIATVLWQPAKKMQAKQLGLSGEKLKRVQTVLMGKHLGTSLATLELIET